MQNLPDPLIPATKAGQGRYTPDFLAAIDHALRVKEQDRPRTVAAWRQQVAALPVAGEPTRPQSPPPPPRPRQEEPDLGAIVSLSARAYPEKRRWRGLVVMAVVVALVGLGVSQRERVAGWMRQGGAQVNRLLQPAAPGNQPAVAPQSRYLVEVGPIKDGARARAVVQAAESNGVAAVTRKDGQGVTVRLGPFDQHGEADRVVGILLNRFPSDIPRLIEQ